MLSGLFGIRLVLFSKSGTTPPRTTLDSRGHEVLRECLKHLLALSSPRDVGGDHLEFVSDASVHQGVEVLGELTHVVVVQVLCRVREGDTLITGHIVLMVYYIVCDEH